MKPFNKLSTHYNIRTLFLVLTVFTISFGYEYPRPTPGYYSQKGQDKYLNEIIFKQKRNGFFVEVGAHDGISFSNTYFFEKELEWTGICVEPNPSIFEVLKKNRNVPCEQLCISDSNALRPFLLCHGYILEMYSGLLDSYNPKHLDRIDKEIEIFGGDKTIITVKCAPLRDLFAQHNLQHIDFMSIDIEGGEEMAIKSIDFNEISIDVIVIENNFEETIISEYLKEKGYVLVEHIGRDDIYLHENYMLKNQFSRRR